MDKSIIIKNKQFNKGLYKVVLKINNENIVGYVDDDGYYDDLSKLDENGNEIEFNSVEEKTQFHQTYVGIFDEMEMNYEIGFGGLDVE